MSQNRDDAGKPLVSLEAKKLLGLRQLAKVSARSADSASSDLGDGTGAASESRARTSRLLSKIGETPPAGA